MEGGRVGARGAEIRRRGTSGRRRNKEMQMWKERGDADVEGERGRGRERERERHVSRGAIAETSKWRRRGGGGSIWLAPPPDDEQLHIVGEGKHGKKWTVDRVFSSKVVGCPCAKGRGMLGRREEEKRPGVWRMRVIMRDMHKWMERFP
jgi:hypothetical protein